MLKATVCLKYTHTHKHLDIHLIPGAISQYMESASSVWLPQHLSGIDLEASSWVRKTKYKYEEHPS